MKNTLNVKGAEMKRKKLKPAQGLILISEPFLNDFYFQRSIILIAEHGKEGSIGLILNKPIDVKLNDVIKDFPKFDSKVYVGGPVKTDNLFVLHTVGEKIPNSTKIIEGLYWGGDIDVIKEMILLNQITPGQIRFFIGYSGWAPNQLEKELKEKSWIVSTSTLKELINTKSEKLWSNSLKKLGTEYILWVNSPPDPSLN